MDPSGVRGVQRSAGCPGNWGGLLRLPPAGPLPGSAGHRHDIASRRPQQCAEKGFSGDRLAQQCQIHALPEGWTDLAYEDFLAKRRQMMARVTREGFRRRADPSYAPDLTIDTSAAPGADLDALTLGDLVLSGHLQPGTQIIGGDSERQFVAEITEEGALRVGTHDYDSPTHAARELGADVDDGLGRRAARSRGTRSVV